MVKESAGASTRTIVSQAFEGDQAPAQLSVAIVSLVELCQLAMPDPDKLRTSLLGAGLVTAPQTKADEAGRMLALDSGLLSQPVKKLRHQMFAGGRQGEPVLFLLSEGDTNDGKVVFCSTIFRGAIEADAVKAAAHVTKQAPFTGSRARNADGHLLRRVFWDTNGVAGIRGFAITGPENVESMELPRAFTAFNKAGKKQ